MVYEWYMNGMKWTYDRAVRMESISSMKIIAGWF